jgi:LytS/YehU family sensor histidine kinase
LIAYLRTAIVEDRNGLASLSKEFDRAKHYLAIMQMRMPDRLQFDIKLPADIDSQVVPTFAVLTLVENAVAHGIDPTENGGWIYVSATVEGDVVHLDVRDTGAGAAPEMAEGFGIRNLRERLMVLWDGQAAFTLQSTAEGTIARIALPRMSVEEATKCFVAGDVASGQASDLTSNKARGAADQKAELR